MNVTDISVKFKWYFSENFSEISQEIFSRVYALEDYLPELEKRERIFLLLITCNLDVSVQRSFLFLLVSRLGCVILSQHSLGLPYNYRKLPQYNMVYREGQKSSSSVTL